ncbi:MAG: divergent polysaccharide deacetylase family protein [Rhodospirillaceae bacterium]
MKLPFSLKRKKKGDDEDEEGLDEDVDNEEEEEPEGGDGDEEEKEGSARSRMGPQRKVLIIAGVAGGLLLTSIISGVAWFLLGADEPPPKVAQQTVNPDGSVALPAGAVPESPPAKGESGKDGKDGKKKPGETGVLLQPPLVDGMSASQVAIQGVGKGALSAAANPQDPNRERIVPFATNSSFAGIRELPEAEQLSRVPDPALIEKIDGGRDLPIIARNGTRPMDAYAKPVADADSVVPKIAILIRGIGLSRSASLTAIKSLPPEVSFVIDPYARDPGDWVVRARLAGHEVFLGLPMESSEFPFEDAGPLALNSTLQVAENMTRLTNLMALIPGYVGFATKFGSKFGLAEGQMRPVFEEIKLRGLMLIDAGESGSTAMRRIATEMEVPRAWVDITLDSDPTEDEIAGKLLRLGALARSQSAAVAIGRPYPNTIRELQNWLKAQAPTKLRLVPVSAMANRQVLQK